MSCSMRPSVMKPKKSVLAKRTRAYSLGTAQHLGYHSTRGLCFLRVSRCMVNDSCISRRSSAFFEKSLLLSAFAQFLCMLDKKAASPVNYRFE